MVWLTSEKEESLSVEIMISSDFGSVYNNFFNLLMMWTYHAIFPVSCEFYMLTAFEWCLDCLVMIAFAEILFRYCQLLHIVGGAFPWKPICLFLLSNTVQEQDAKR